MGVMGVMVHNWVRHGNLAFANEKREKEEPGDLLPSSLLKSEDMK